MNTNDHTIVPTAATIGFFDGVHRGHRFLFSQLEEAAAMRNLHTLAISFTTHPRAVLQTDFHPQLLTTLHEREELLRSAGVEKVAMIDFTDVMNLTSADFMEQILLKAYGVELLVVGYDHHFGCDRDSSFEDYAEQGRRLGIEVVQAEPLREADVKVSSSQTRRFLQAGNVEGARWCLGRPYRLGGTVIEGRHVGQQIGYPTANLQPDSSEKIVPKNGVYVAEALLPCGRFRAVVNIGTRPTLNNGTDRTIEAHLPDFCGNLYGQHVTLDFLHRLRDEQSFDSLEQLRSQIARDTEDCRQYEPSAN